MSYVPDCPQPQNSGLFCFYEEIKVVLTTLKFIISTRTVGTTVTPQQNTNAASINAAVLISSAGSCPWREM